MEIDKVEKKWRWERIYVGYDASCFGVGHTETNGIHQIFYLLICCSIIHTTFYFFNTSKFNSHSFFLMEISSFNISSPLK